MANSKKVNDLALRIKLAKANANGKPYFELFKSNNSIPFGISGDILYISIGNLDCLRLLIEKNPNAKHYIIDNSFINNVVRICLKKNCIYSIKCINADKDLDLYNLI